jgi:hypothetical protein
MSDQPEPQNKDELMHLIYSERAALEETLRRFDADAMLQPIEPDGWTVKDYLAHIAVWERRFVQWTEESLRGETPQRPAPGMTWDDLDRLNAINYQESKDLPLESVLEEFNASYARVLDTLAGLNDDDLFNPSRFAWRNGDPLWHMVAANTWWHYMEHNETIRNGLEG